MNISNNYRMNYSTNYKKNESRKSEQKVSNPDNNSLVSFGSIHKKIIILGLMNDSMNSQSPQKTQSNKNSDYTPRHISASEMDLKKLNEKLYFTNIELDGNKVKLENSSLRGKLNTTTDIPEEFFEGCETKEDKEYQVKKWLVESKDDLNFENIPYELMKAADDINFYKVDNHRLQLDADTKAREKGIVIGKIEKADDNDYTNLKTVNMKVDGEPFTFKINVKEKYDLLNAAANYDDDYTNNYYKDIFMNIKDSHQCNVYRDGDKEYFIPKIIKGEPNIDNDILIMNGNTDKESYKKESATYKLSEFLGKDLEKDNVKPIMYTDKDSFPLGKRLTAYGYYDCDTDTKYIYNQDKQVVTRQDSNGKISKIALK